MASGYDSYLIDSSDKNFEKIPTVLSNDNIDGSTIKTKKTRGEKSLFLNYLETLKETDDLKENSMTSLHCDMRHKMQSYCAIKKPLDIFTLGDNLGSEFIDPVSDPLFFCSFGTPTRSVTITDSVNPASNSLPGLRVTPEPLAFRDLDPNRDLLGFAFEQKVKPPKVLANRYLLGVTIGRGSYGKVKDCIDLISLRRYAIKVVSRLGVRRIPGGWQKTLVEASLLSRLPAHSQVVSMVGALRVESPERLCLVMEHCLGSVHDLQAAGIHSLQETQYHRLPVQRIATVPTLEAQHDLPQTRKVSVVKVDDSSTSQQQFRRLCEAQAHAYFLQLIHGVAFLHRQGIIHRDIKPANLLLTPAPGCGLSVDSQSSHARAEWRGYEGSCEVGVNLYTPSELLAASRGFLVKLADFGVSTAISAFATEARVGGGQTTPAVQSPEVARGVEELFDGPRLDIYSAGVTLFFMVTGHVPFSRANFLQVYESIIGGLYIIPGHVSPRVANLIRGMMCNNPENRLSLRDVIRHPWLCEMPIQPPDLQECLQICADRLCSADACTRGRGVACWLDPFEYLSRPTPKFLPPHIDAEGARLFSRAEIEILAVSRRQVFSPIRDSIPDSFKVSPTKTLDQCCERPLQMSNLKQQIAPFSVCRALSLYTWYQSKMAPTPECLQCSSNPIADSFAKFGLQHQEAAFTGSSALEKAGLTQVACSPFCRDQPVRRRHNTVSGCSSFPPASPLDLPIAVTLTSVGFSQHLGSLSATQLSRFAWHLGQQRGLSQHPPVALPADTIREDSQLEELFAERCDVSLSACRRMWSWFSGLRQRVHSHLAAGLRRRKTLKYAEEAVATEIVDHHQ